MPGFGVGEAVGGVAQAHAQNKATAAQERMGTQAINEQRRQQTQERDRLRQMWDYWQFNRNQLMAKYGLDVPSTARGDNPFDDAHDRYVGRVAGGSGRPTTLADLAGRGKPIRDEWEA